MTLKTKFAAVLTSAAMVSTLLAPVAFADNSITENGTGSTNLIKVSDSSHCTVSQSNNTNVTTTVSATANTGENQANDNTGSGVSIGTGDATNGVTVGVSGGSNEASNPCCGCLQLELLDGLGGNDISGNGSNTDNKIVVKSHSSQKVTQKNKTWVSTLAALKAKTGKNKANANTGGSVDTTTGSATNLVDVLVDASSNSL